MINCTGCGKPIDKLPSWLAGTKVDFVCNNCPNRTAKSIAFMQLEEAKTSARVDDDDKMDEEEVGDDLEE
jgi:hypothetical protein